MDGDHFDDLARRVARAGHLPRRAVLRGAAGGLLAAVLAGVDAGAARAQEVVTAACLGPGARCSRRKQPGCGQCCSGYATRQNNGQRRCACRPDARRCDRDDQCCSALCCDVDGDRVCIPGFFACNGRCPTAACSTAPA